MISYKKKEVGFYLGNKVLFKLIIFVLFANHGALPSFITSYMEEHQPAPHATSIIVDSHLDTLTKVIDEETWLPTTDIGEETSFESDIPKLKNGGIQVPFLAAYTPGFYNNTARSLSHTLAMINALYWTEEKNPNDLKVTSTTDEILNALGEGKIAAVPSIEGAYSLDGNNAIELLGQYHDLGIMTIGFTWNYSNDLGEGAHRVFGDQMKTPSSGGLTELGEEVALEMNRLGMMIDVSHMAESTFWDVLEVSEAPVIATHSGIDTLHHHVRNLTDEQLLALAENGGVLAIVFYPSFLTETGNATISDVVDHIDYAVDLIGVDHVAIGSDFDGATLPSDLQDASEMEKLTDELMSRGYSTMDMKKILGLNTLRVMHEVQQRSEVIESDETIEIIPTYKMGEQISERSPLLEAELKGEIPQEDDLAVVLDGVVYPATFDDQDSTMYFQVEEELKEQFHVVTFIVNSERETRIFYVE